MFRKQSSKHYSHIWTTSADEEPQFLDRKKCLLLAFRNQEPIANARHDFALYYGGILTPIVPAYWHEDPFLEQLVDILRPAPDPLPVFRK